ncbi:MAG: STT3 domain-containing protein [Promethearchaeota archaeon]
MVKIVASLRNFRDRIRTSISVKTRNFLFFFAIVLLVILAILIRCSPIIRDVYLIKAFDPWIQWYNAEYLNEHTLYEYFNWVDYKSWYPSGFFRGGLRPGLTFTVVILYKIFNFFGLPISLYQICFFFPAFMGGLTVLVMYFLGKEVLDRSTGLFAAFFLAFNPGYLQRTTAGFFDNETIGVFATLMTFLFFLKAIRTGKFSRAVIGGLFLGYLSLSWGGYQFVYLLIPLICIILVLTNKYSENVLVSYAGVQGTGLLIFSLYSKFRYNSLFSDLSVGGIFLFTIILVIFHIIQTKKTEHPKVYNSIINTVKWVLIPGILIFAIIIWIAPEILPFGFGARFMSILSPLFRENISIVASVAEQMPSAWSVFYYNTLIPLVLVPLGIYFCFKRLNAADIFVIAFIILMYYFTGSMIRIILVFAPAAALAAAYGLVNILKIFGSFLGEKKVSVSRKRKRQLKGTLGSTETLVIYAVVGFLCIAQVVHTTNIAVTNLSFAQMSPLGVIHEWEEALTWTKDNLQGTDVVVSWWDYGYWLTPVGNVTTVNDNATKNQTVIGMTGMALMQTNELYSARILRMLKADYVLVYFGFFYSGLGGDEGKWPWMVHIPNDNYNTYLRMGLEEDNWKANSIFDINEYQNQTTGAFGDKWFQSQLCRMMFWYEPTVSDPQNHDQFEENYAREINRRRDNDGDLWVTHIPPNGNYDSKVFIPRYFSKFGMVKIFEIDYTVLDSTFDIENPEVLDTGYGTFKIVNTGKKDLEIQNVEINGTNYDFYLGSGGTTIESGSEDLIWVDIKSQGSTFQKNDVVSINVTAGSTGLYGRPYSFSEKTSSLFVKTAKEGKIRINKENSIIIQKDTSTVDLYLEVENIGKSTVLLDRYYVNDDTIENKLNPASYNYLSGSAILEPTDKAFIKISDAIIDFYPIKEYNKIGVATPNNISDELLFTSSVENYSLSILSQNRILSPELQATFGGNYRNHIPIAFNESYAYAHDNGTIALNIKIKNTGDIVFGIAEVYLTESLLSANFDVIPGKKTLQKNEERLIKIGIDTNDPANAKYGLTGDINEEILVCITGSFSELETVVSDIGYIHTIRDQEDIHIIESVEGTAVSYISANETGKLLIKNTGNEPITLESVILNNTITLDFSDPSDIEFLYGDSSLGVQECALISFDIPTLKINKSDDIIVNITTTTAAEYVTTLKAIVETEFYSITVDPTSKIDDSDNRITIKIVNNGQLNVTLDAIYINKTYIPLSSFIFQVGNSFEIDSLGGTITIYLNNLEDLIGSISPGDEFIILARTLEGAEDTQQEFVVA